MKTDLPSSTPLPTLKLGEMHPNRIRLAYDHYIEGASNSNLPHDHVQAIVHGHFEWRLRQVNDVRVRREYSSRSRGTARRSRRRNRDQEIRTYTFFNRHYNRVFEYNIGWEVRSTTFLCKV